MIFTGNPLVIRKQLGVSQNTMAQMLGVQSYVTISRWETAAAIPTHVYGEMYQAFEDALKNPDGAKRVLQAHAQASRWEFLAMLFTMAAETRRGR